MKALSSSTVLIVCLLPLNALALCAVPSVGAVIRTKSKRRPLSTKTVLWSPEVEQQQLNEHYSARRGILASLPFELGRISRINGANAVRIPERDSFPIMRANISLALQRLTPQTRWVSLLVCAGLVSSFLWLPLRPVHALEAAGAVSASLMPEAVGIAVASGQFGSVSAAATNAAALTISPIPVMVQLRLTLRMLYAAILGALVGKERAGSREHRYSRPAGGVRTMALVSLGAATFTLCSMYGFGSVGASRYDPSRMAANVSSGVGFIGAGVITTTAGQSQSSTSNNCSIVHGLTTAAAIWLSAAVGVGCGVGMSVLSTAAAVLTIAILRIGERHQNVEEAKRKLSEQHANSQRTYEDQLLLKELRRHSASNPSLHSFQKEIEESLSFATTKGNELVVTSLQSPTDAGDSTGSISRLME